MATGRGKTAVFTTLGGTLAAIALLYASVVALMTVFQERLVYLPSSGHAADPGHLGLSFENVWLTTEDGVRVHAWFVPAARATGRTVLFFHGNAGNISHRLDTLRLYHALGLNVLLPDYRGYGASDGQPSERGTVLDARAAWAHLRDGRGIEPRQILVHGRSLGAAVALALAVEVDAGAVVVESAFTSVPDLGAELYPWLPVRLVARIHYPNRARVANLGQPLLIAHSPHDALIPYAHGKALLAAAPPGTQWLEMRGGHNDGFIVTGTLYAETLRQFIDRHLPSP